MWLGTKLFSYVDIYAPGDDDAEVVALTFSNNSDYIEKVSEIEL